jgi:hypothetical protein
VTKRAVTGIQSPAWAFFQRFVLFNTVTGVIYLQRLRVIGTPWFSIMLHRIRRPDPDPDRHDHPWNFWSLVLWGSYEEDSGGVVKRVRWVNRHRAEDTHRITRVFGPVVTLVITGRRRRNWGFWKDNVFVPWRQYMQQRDAHDANTGGTRAHPLRPVRGTSL